MKWLGKLTLGAASASLLLLMVAIVQAGSWQDFKLQYYALTQILHDQDQELDDLRKQGTPPQQNSRIELGELLNGGPPKDGIPSIDNPEFDTPTTTPFSEDETVIGVVINGEAKAYPFGVMNWHEIVNDTVGGVNITISYCPLCDTIVAFERGDTTFGVSGKLYQSCLILYDRADDSLFVQPWALGVVGPQMNQSLGRIPAVKTTLKAWLAQYPESQILATRTGHDRAYQGYPYGSYYTNERLIFPVRNQAQRQHHPKAIVSYIWAADPQTPHNQFAGASHQFIHEELREAGSQTVDFQGQPLVARWDATLETVVVEDREGRVIPSSTAFAFVYPAFFGSAQ